MRILAVIPARGGSKRLPGKNVRRFGEKPLIVWSIDVAKNVPEICDILVSTDDAAIAAVCTEADAFVPWLRPPELATDSANSVDVVLHALDWYETEKGTVDGVLLLQPTSPFRTRETVRKGIDLFTENERQQVLGVSPIEAHPMWALKKSGDFVVPFFENDALGIRSQDLPPAFIVNGSFYLTTPRELRVYKSFVGRNTLPLIIESQCEALDIDTEWDWMIAEAVLAKHAQQEFK